jgi:flagellar protein FliO/FliZ
VTREAFPAVRTSAACTAVTALVPGLAAANTADGGSPVGAALQAIAGLGIVLVLIVATAWVLRRLQPGRFAQSALLKPVAQMSLGTRERIVVVEMGETWLVLGVTANGINTLHTTARSELPAAGTPMATATAPFAEWLARARSAPRSAPPASPQQPSPQ